MIWTMVTSILDLLRYMDYIPNIYTVPRRNKAFFECKCSLELPLVVVRRSGILLVATTSASSLSHSMTPIIQMPGAPEIPRRLKKPRRACRCEPNISMWLDICWKQRLTCFPSDRWYYVRFTCTSFSVLLVKCLEQTIERVMIFQPSAIHQTSPCNIKKSWVGIAKQQRIQTYSTNWIKVTVVMVLDKNKKKQNCRTVSCIVFHLIRLKRFFEGYWYLTRQKYWCQYVIHSAKFQSYPFPTSSHAQSLWNWKVLMINT